MHAKDIDIYIGPTAEDIDLSEIKRFCNIKSPIKRGDLEATAKNVRIIVIVDGLFGGYPSVGHREIISRIHEGIVIVGCSSMGAIRAFELRNEGMLGFGKVYERFLHFQGDFTDDEVAQIHILDGYKSMSEPLVNLRYFLETLRDNGEIEAFDAQKIVEKFSHLYFGERTIEQYVREISSATQQPYTELLERFKHERIKQQDFLNLMKRIYNNEIIQSTH